MTRTIKAYKNPAFLNAPVARPIRILCEYEEPRHRFRQLGVRDTVVFFGSARFVSGARAEEDLLSARAALEEATGPEAQREARARLERAERARLTARFYDEARQLAARLTAWSRRERGGRYLVCTGGGPGIMEAANRGAAEVPGGRSVGLGISLPFEEKVNRYVSEELAFEFHYFFMRKYWFMYLAKAMVVFPGGFGTLDELAELLTLRQTRKVTKPLPTILYGSSYWDEVLDLDAMVRWGTIAEADLALLHRADNVQAAFDILVEELTAAAEADDRK